MKTPHKTISSVLARKKIPMEHELSADDLKKKLIRDEDGDCSVAGMRFEKYRFASSGSYESDWMKIVYLIDNPVPGFPPVLLVAMNRRRNAYKRSSELFKTLEPVGHHAAYVSNSSVIICPHCTLSDIFSVRFWPHAHYSVKQNHDGAWGITSVRYAASMADLISELGSPVSRIEYPKNGIVSHNNGIIFGGIKMTKENAIWLFTSILNQPQVGSSQAILSVLYPQVMCLHAQQTSFDASATLAGLLTEMATALEEILLAEMAMKSKKLTELMTKPL